MIIPLCQLVFARSILQSGRDQLDEGSIMFIVNRWYEMMKSQESLSLWLYGVICNWGPTAPISNELDPRLEPDLVVADELIE